MQEIVQELNRHQVAMTDLLTDAPPQVRAAMKLQVGHTKHVACDIENYLRMKDRLHYNEVTNEV